MSNMRRRIFLASNSTTTRKSKKTINRRRRATAVLLCQWDNIYIYTYTRAPVRGCRWARIYGGASTLTERLDYGSAEARLCRRCVLRFLCVYTPAWCNLTLYPYHDLRSKLHPSCLFSIFGQRCTGCMRTWVQSSMISRTRFVYRE